MKWAELRVYQRAVKDQGVTTNWLYRDVLHRNSQFHFLYEPDFLLVRADPPTIEMCRRIVAPYKSDVREGWHENNPDVDANKKFFAVYLHSVSVLALEENGVDIRAVTERMVHCWFNVCGEEFDEAAVLASLAIERSWMAGFQAHGLPDEMLRRRDRFTAAERRHGLVE